MESRYYITGESFGSNCPENWEEIAGSLNGYLEAIWNSMNKEERESFPEVVRELWEDWCQHEGTDCLPLDTARKAAEIDERINALKARFKAECEEIAEECQDEGYPAHGENCDLRCSGLWDEYYQALVDDLADLIEGEQDD